MKFTLIICTYKRPKPLLTLLQSVKEQTLYPDQVLIIDGSPDDATKQIIANNNFQNLNYHQVEPQNRGLTKQRNFGIEKTDNLSDIVCFLDDDTVLTPNYFEEIIKTYQQYPEALGVGGYINNEIKWIEVGENYKPNLNYFHYDGWKRKDGFRFIFRKKIGLDSNCLPGFLPEFSHGRSIGFLPPSGKTYEVHQLMGGVSSFKKIIFQEFKFSTYFEGYGLYEDADFTLRLSNKGKLFVNTAAQLEHHHDPAGRPNKYEYGKMVVRNGWYVWRVKYPKPSFQAKIKWHLITLLLTVIRATNIITTAKRKEAMTETLGRLVGYFMLLISKPKIQ